MYKQTIELFNQMKKDFDNREKQYKKSRLIHDRHAESLRKEFDEQKERVKSRLNTIQSK
ncbi:MAG: hypothetical protein MR008_03755 [Aerococcus sp.]|nr:hypothetical protein [Aerococcus sp.]